MPAKTVAGTAVDTNDEGFFTDPDQWTESMAPELAAAATGVAPGLASDVTGGDALAAVPGLGVDVALAAGAGEPGFDLRWHPAATA